MNAVEIEQAISQLADQPFDAADFPYAFLEAFGNKDTTIKRLRAGASNKSDLGGVLQTNNIHIATCDADQVTNALRALRQSPATAKAKAKFILATDGVGFEAEDLAAKGGRDRQIQRKLGERVRALRKEKGFSQEGFADACALHRTYMGSVERGETNPTLSSLATIARALKITTSKLVEGVD